MFILIAIIICLIFFRRDTAVFNILKGFFDKISPTRKVFETAAEVAARDVPLESHFVTTSDGYILNLFRIFHKLPAPGRVVLFQHGMLSNSSDWVAVDQSIAFQLVEKGWDVWLGNNRGNVYCREHVTFSRYSKSFNSYSFHEMGMYDLPAIIDYIREKTDRQKIVYVGHSQGNSQFFAMMSLLPEMNDKILAMFALAPVASLAHARARVQIMYKMAVILRAPRRIFEMIGFHRLSSYFPRFLYPLLDITSPLWCPIANYAVGHRLLNIFCSYPCPTIICNSFEYFFLFRIRNGTTWQELEHYSRA
ncbi:hypothetical protein GE061_002608 [Apolygus lucorum]|uniref:Partial AB-hydrolase lipase domain-containing protein n=1 Tax=Apolygus lucorum TaxID=248454 RepID=A0A8S9X7D5_APOLU|nr:hypothetical protein GE061_002608 [Apolygus lucorum]